MSDERTNNRLNSALLLMNEEIQLLKALKNNLSSQKDLIFSDSAESFAEAVRLEDDLLARIKKVDRERLAVMNELSVVYNIESQITLTKLIDLVDPIYKPKVSVIKKVFLNLIGEIRKLNLENRYLVRKSVALVQKNLAILKDFTKNDYVYSMTGGYGQVHTPVRRLLDTKF